ncbi:DNA topoisomerase IB [soil metagenome]
MTGRQSELVYVSSDEPGIGRRRTRTGFAYVGTNGKPLRDPATLKRIRSLVIPPAWVNVWICVDPAGHVQATGRDAAGRKQYRYHADFRTLRDGAKYEHLATFAEALPVLRRQVAADMGRRGLPREKVLATVVHLLDTTLIRVGNGEYARQNGSFGLTTLRDRHVAIAGDALRFEFKGKSGKAWKLRMRDRRVARIVRSCQELPGQHLFQYLDADGRHGSVGSTDVNAYLRAVTGADITAKDFRTFAGTVVAAEALAAYDGTDSLTLRKANVRAAIDRVATRLGNTPAVTRACYVHPAVVEAYLNGALALPARRRAGLAGEEAAVMAFLHDRVTPRRRRTAHGTPASLAASPA